MTRLVTTLKKSLESLADLTTYHWTDSTVVLHWIYNCKPWRQYARHRVNEIRCHSSSEEWNHCPGNCNPADMPSRGLKGRELVESKSWWTGPEFSSLPKSNWPCTPPLDECEEAQFELIKNDLRFLTPSLCLNLHVSCNHSEDDWLQGCSVEENGDLPQDVVEGDDSQPCANVSEQSWTEVSSALCRDNTVSDNNFPSAFPVTNRFSSLSVEYASLYS